MGLALDESKENDTTYDHDGFTLVVDEGLMKTCGDIKIDFIDDGPRSGFSIQSTMPVGGGGCGSSCSTNGCG